MSACPWCGSIVGHALDCKRLNVHDVTIRSIFGYDADDNQHARHLGAVQVTSAMLFDLMKTSPGRYISCDGVPEDAKAIGIYPPDRIDPTTIVVLFEHPSFPLHRPGEIVQMLPPPRFTQRYDPPSGDPTGGAI